MDPDDLLASWRAEETGQPEGWDFSSLADRMTEDPVPWDLDAAYAEALDAAEHVLDMGTGGGEHLLRFLDRLPADTVATEGWSPNVPVAERALRPHGVDVVAWPADDESDLDQMPFPDGRFDLVLNRHESFDAREVARVLAPGGVLLTQQVAGDEMAELHELTGKQPDHPEVRLDLFREALVQAGLDVVDGAEHVGSYVFDDVAALVAYLQLVPWDVPDDFSVDRYADAMLALHARGPDRGQPLRLTRKRFWLRARRPGVV